MKRPRLTIISIIVIIFGSILLSVGIDKIFGEDTQKLNLEIDESRKPTNEHSIGKPIVFDVSPTYDSVEIAPAYPILLTIEKDVIFDGDIVKIKAEAQNVRDNVLLISIILNDGSWSLLNKTFGEIQFEREYAEKYNLLLDLTGDSNPPFTDETIVKFTKPDMSYHMTGAVLFNDTQFSIINPSESLFRIYSQTDKLQVETNNAILEQIAQTEINNLQQEKTNQLFLGLSIIGIALIPILGGFDLLLRLHID